MIPLEKIKSSKPGDLVIYAAPSETGVFYSGKVIEQPEGLTKPLYLRLIPVDARLLPTRLKHPDFGQSKPLHFVRELAFNSGIAFQVSEEDLRGTYDLTEKLHAQAKNTDLRTDLAVGYLLEQLPEVRRNFAP